jgi:hypothetical protein
MPFIVRCGHDMSYDALQERENRKIQRRGKKKGFLVRS